MDRRKFIKQSCTLGGLTIVGGLAFLESCKKETTNTSPQGPSVNFTLDLSSPSNAVLNNPGGSLASNGVVIVNLSGSYTAVAQACTHNGCSVNYSSSGNNFVCPCHGGVFDINGGVSSGPPPAPLKKYTVTKSGTVLTIVG